MKLRSIFKKRSKELTEEEMFEIQKGIKALYEIRDMARANYSGFKVNNTSTKLANRFYRDNFIKAAILEAFAYSDELSTKELNTAISSYLPNRINRNITVKHKHLIIIQMAKLGFITGEKTNEKYSMLFRITEIGLEALRQQTFQNLAASSFFNYKARNLNIVMSFITVMSLVVALGAIFKPNDRELLDRIEHVIQSKYSVDKQKSSEKIIPISIQNNRKVDSIVKEIKVENRKPIQVEIEAENNIKK